MKKILYTLLAGAMALSSCSKSDDMSTAPQTEATTFTLAIDAAETRAASTITPARYIMEVWSEDGTTAENVFENGTKNHAEITSGNAFTIILDKTKAYTCLFWADSDADNTTGSFNAAELKAIGVNTGKSATEAYFSKVAVAKGKNPAVAVTLDRAVAKITLTETASVKTTDDLSLKLSNVYPTFDVLTGTATGTAAEWTKTIKPSATTGKIATFYFFAKIDAELSDLKFTYATEAEKTVSNIPVQQNFATNIKGEYSNVGSFTFTITADDEWLTPGNDEEFPMKPKVGNFLYKDKTFSSTYIADAQNPCIGIVFWVDPANANKGKIVGLTEPEANWNGGKNKAGTLTWGPVGTITNAIDVENGATNMTTIKALDPTLAAYPAFAWAESQNATAIEGITWYLPAKNELRQLQTAMCGLKLVASGAGPGEINDWRDGTSMPGYETYKDVREAFNSKFTSANGTPMGITSGAPSYYWSSTEKTGDRALIVIVNAGITDPFPKNFDYHVRVVSAY